MPTQSTSTAADVLIRQSELDHLQEMETAIQDRIATLRSELSSIVEQNSTREIVRNESKLVSALPAVSAVPSGRRTMSAAARARIANAQRLRWQLKRRQDAQQQHVAASTAEAPGRKAKAKSKATKTKAASKKTRSRVAPLSASGISAADMAALTAPASE